jgi:hypothetical protein
MDGAIHFLGEKFFQEGASGWAVINNKETAGIKIA